MTKRDMLQLEKDLRGDLEQMDEAVLARVRKSVEEFLLHEAGKLAGVRVKDEDTILDLIQLHARVNLLRKIIQNPTGFNQKDMKELFRTIGDDKRSKLSEGPTDPLSLISGLNINDDEKAKLAESVFEVMKGRMRASLGKGVKHEAESTATEQAPPALESGEPDA